MGVFESAYMKLGEHDIFLNNEIMGADVPGIVRICGQRHRSDIGNNSNNLISVNADDWNYRPVSETQIVEKINDAPKAQKQGWSPEGI